MLFKTAKNNQGGRTSRTDDKANNRKAWYLQQKMLLPLVMIVAFAAAGSYLVRSSQAATSYPVSMLGDHNCYTVGQDLPPSLGQGNVGDCVRALQIGLNNWLAFRAWVNPGRFAFHPIATDGNFGPQTRNAVVEYQRENSDNGKRLAVDGYVGPSTWASLLNNCAAVQTCGWGK